MKAIHFICRRDLDGVNLNNLSFDTVANIFRSGYWDLSEADAQALIGGWIYLHPRKSAPSEFGGIIQGYVTEIHPSFAHPNRIVFLVERRPEGEGASWRGKSHAMAFTSGLVEAALVHENIQPALSRSREGPTTELETLYHTYWKNFRDRIDARQDPSVSIKPPSKEQYFQVFLAGPHQVFSARLGGSRKRIAVEFCLLYDEERKLFQHLKANTPGLEAATGQSITWSDKPGVPRCHLIIWRENCDLFEQSQWTNYQRWQWEHLLKLRAGVTPLLQQVHGRS